MKLIVGLGNPGKEYIGTRHNIGFMVIDNYLNISDNDYKKNFDGLYYERIIKGDKVIFLKPQRYMNLSGEVVIQYVKFYKIDINDILVVSDDLDMECGKIKLKLKGSCGGHNGLRNIENHLGTQEYKRLKIGISKTKDKDIKDYVLGNFSKEEKLEIDRIINETKNIIDDYFELSFENLMNKYN